MATETDLATQVMQELLLIDANETPSAEDAAVIIARYHQRLLMLTDEDYSDWMAGSSTADDVIPDAAMPGLIRVMAFEVAPMFGKGRERLIEANGDTWEMRGLAMLRRVMRKKPSYEPVRADYF